MDRCGDHHSPIYRDGSLDVSFDNPSPIVSSFREKAGYLQGLNDSKSILDQLTPGESAKIFAHSMGCSYATVMLKLEKESQII